jgi:hypothetical protein
VSKKTSNGHDTSDEERRMSKDGSSVEKIFEAGAFGRKKGYIRGFSGLF